MDEYIEALVYTHDNRIVKRSVKIIEKFFVHGFDLALHSSNGSGFKYTISEVLSGAGVASASDIPNCIEILNHMRDKHPIERWQEAINNAVRKYEESSK